MESSLLPIFRFVTLAVFTVTFFSNFKPIKSVHVSQHPQPPPPPVPAYFLIGDSSSVDHLGLHLGLPLVLSYLGQSGAVEHMKHGLNYASTDARIIFSSGSESGQHISFSRQIQQVMDTFQQFILSMGEKAATDHISSSLFYISIGTNDFIHYYLHDVSGAQSKYLSWGFAQFLASSMKQEIKNLYNAKVRRVVVMGLAPIGCAPHYLWQYNNNNRECVKKINDMIMEFNFVMRDTVQELTKELSDANIGFRDSYIDSMDILKNADQFGSVRNSASCGLGRYNGWITCLSAGMAYRNEIFAEKDEHVSFWQQIQQKDFIKRDHPEVSGVPSKYTAMGIAEMDSTITFMNTALLQNSFLLAFTVVTSVLLAWRWVRIYDPNYCYQLDASDCREEHTKPDTWRRHKML